jgi:hypothetical protein
MRIDLLMSRPGLIGSAFFVRSAGESRAFTKNVEICNFAHVLVYCSVERNMPSSMTRGSVRARRHANLYKKPRKEIPL